MFLILTTQRSGSTLLVDLLDQHPGVMCKGEIFSGYSQEKLSYFESYCVRDLMIENDDVTLRHRLLTSFLRENIENSNSLFGFKLMIDQFFDYRFNESIFNEFLPNVKIIRLTRDNSLDVLVSRLRSTVTDFYHATDEKSIQKIKIHIDPKLVVSQLDDVIAANDFIRTLMPDYLSITVSYDDLVSNVENSMSRIYDFLGVDMSFLPVPKYKKIGSYDLSDDVENFEEIACVLRDSKYSDLLVRGVI